MMTAVPNKSHRGQTNTIAENNIIQNNGRPKLAIIDCTKDRGRQADAQNEVGPTELMYLWRNLHTFIFALHGSCMIYTTRS